MFTVALLNQFKGTKIYKMILNLSKGPFPLNPSYLVWDIVLHAIHNWGHVVRSIW